MIRCVFLSLFAYLPLVAPWGHPDLIQEPSEVLSDSDPAIQAQISRANIDARLAVVYSIAELLAVDPRQADVYVLRSNDKTVYLELYKKQEKASPLPLDECLFAGSNPGPTGPPYIRLSLALQTGGIHCVTDEESKPGAEQVTAFRALETAKACLRKAVPEVFPLHPTSSMGRTETYWTFTIPYHYKGVAFYRQPLNLSVSLITNRVLSLSHFTAPRSDEYPESILTEITEAEATSIALESYGTFLRRRSSGRFAVQLPDNTPKGPRQVILTPKFQPNVETYSPYPEYPVTPMGAARVCWRVALYPQRKEGRCVDVLVDATNGRILKVQVMGYGPQAVEQSIKDGPSPRLLLNQVKPDTFWPERQHEQMGYKSGSPG